MKTYLTALIIIAAMTTGRSTADQEANNITPFCYQGLCLNDSIEKLSLLVIAPEKKYLATIKRPFILSQEATKSATKIFIGDKKDIEFLLRQGFLSNRRVMIDKKTLDTLKKIKTICGEATSFVDISVTANNGKRLELAYTPMTDKNGVSSYGLIAISAPYPEVQSRNEMDELISLASLAMNVKFECSDIGTGRTCSDSGMTQVLKIENGWLDIAPSRRKGFDYNFDINRTRDNPLCKKDINY